jgi:dihydroorotase
LDDLRYANVPKAVEMIERNRDLILGVKVRLTKHSIVSEASGTKPLHLAREAADAVGLPIMVHPQDSWFNNLDEILAVMRTGDILTHCFHGGEIGLLEGEGQDLKVRRAVHEAFERGVRFDVGHGAGSFNWHVAETALRQGFVPQTISSDLHLYNLNGPVYDLATTVSKFLHLGLTLDEALAKVTSIPAEVLKMQGEIGTLQPGAWGDAVVFDLREGEFPLVDSHGERRMGRQMLVPQTVVRAGRVYEAH